MKYNNSVTRISLCVLLFVVFYSLLIKYYKTEYFATTDVIDKVSGWQGAHENPGVKKQTEESCRQLALKNPKYVAWGFRNRLHPDNNYRNTCFLYTQGFQPFKGDPKDYIHITGCLRPGEKVSEGCKQVTVRPTNVQSTNIPSGIDSVFGWQGDHHDKSSLKNQSEESCRQMALNDPKYAAYGFRTSAHPDPNFKNTCFLYTQGFKPFNGNPSDTAHKTGCLRPGEKVNQGCKPVSTSTQQTQSVQPAQQQIPAENRLCNTYDNIKGAMKRNSYKKISTGDEKVCKAECNYDKACTAYVTNDGTRSKQCILYKDPIGTQDIDIVPSSFPGSVNVRQNFSNTSQTCNTGFPITWERVYAQQALDDAEKARKLLEESQKKSVCNYLPGDFQLGIKPMRTTNATNKVDCERDCNNEPDCDLYTYEGKCDIYKDGRKNLIDWWSNKYDYGKGMMKVYEKDKCQKQ